jgi:hypothetical protein
MSSLKPTPVAEPGDCVIQSGNLALLDNSHLQRRIDTPCRNLLQSL